MSEKTFKIPQSMLSEVVQPLRMQGQTQGDSARLVGHAERRASGRVELEKEMAQEIASMIVDRDRAGASSNAEGRAALANDVVSRMQTSAGLSQAAGSRVGFNPWAPHCRYASVPFLDPAHAEVCKDYLDGVLRDLRIHDAHDSSNAPRDSGVSRPPDLEGSRKPLNQNGQVEDSAGTTRVTRAPGRPLVGFSGDQTARLGVKISHSDYQGATGLSEDQSNLDHQEQDRMVEVAYLTERLSALLDHGVADSASVCHGTGDDQQKNSRGEKPVEVVIKTGGAGASRDGGPVKRDFVKEPSNHQAGVGNVTIAADIHCAFEAKAVQTGDLDDANADIHSFETTSAAQSGESASAKVHAATSTSRLDPRVENYVQADQHSFPNGNALRMGRKMIGTVGADENGVFVAIQRGSSVRSALPGKVTAMERVGKKHPRIAETSQVMAKICKKLASKVKGLTSMFAEFDRPDWNGKSDKSIDVTEFEMGVVDLGLDLSTQQIKDVFHLVDKDGSGTIELSEFESVLRAHGAIRPIAVKRADVSSIRRMEQGNTSSAKKNSRNVQESETLVTRQLSQQPAGLTRQMSEQLTGLHQGVAKGQRMVTNLEGISSQFEALRFQYENAVAREQARETESLVSAGEDFVRRLDDGIDHVTEHLDAMHLVTVSIVHQLPTDFRVVWKQALCREIDSTSAQLRALVGKLPLLEEIALSLSATCHEWRKQSHRHIEDMKNKVMRDRGEMVQIACKGGLAMNDDEHATLLQESRKWLALTQHHSFVASAEEWDSISDHVMAARRLAQVLQAPPPVPAAADSIEGHCADHFEASLSDERWQEIGPTVSSNGGRGDAWRDTDFDVFNNKGMVAGQRWLSVLGGSMDYNKIKTELQRVKDERDKLVEHDKITDDISTKVESNYIASEVSMSIGRALRQLDSIPPDGAANLHVPSSTKKKVSSNIHSPADLPPPRKMAFGRPVQEHIRGRPVQEHIRDAQAAQVLVKHHQQPGNVGAESRKVMMETTDVSAAVEPNRSKPGQGEVPKLSAKRLSKRPQGGSKASFLTAKGAVKMLHASNASEAEVASDEFEIATHVKLMLNCEHGLLDSKEILSNVFAMAVGISPAQVSCAEMQYLEDAMLQVSIKIVGNHNVHLQTCASDATCAMWTNLPLASIALGEQTFEKYASTGLPPRDDYLAATQRHESPELNAYYEHVSSGHSASPGISSSQVNGLSSEETLADWIQSYLSHHLYGRVLIQASSKRLPPILLTQLASECSRKELSETSRLLLGSDGLQLLMHAGVEISDAEILSIASEALETAAKKAVNLPWKESAEQEKTSDFEFHPLSLASLSPLTDSTLYPASDDRNVEALILRMFLQAVLHQEVEVAHSAMRLLGTSSSEDRDEIPEPNIVVQLTKAARPHDKENDIFISRPSHGTSGSERASSRGKSEHGQNTVGSTDLGSEQMMVSQLDVGGEDRAFPSFKPSTLLSDVTDAVLTVACAGSPLVPSKSSFPLDETVRKIADSLQAIELRMSTPQVQLPEAPLQSASPEQPSGRLFASPVPDTAIIAIEIALALHNHMKQDKVTAFSEEQAVAGEPEGARLLPQREHQRDNEPKKILVKDVSCETDAYTLSHVQGDAELTAEAVGNVVQLAFEYVEADDVMSLSAVSDSLLGEDDVSAESHTLSWISLLTRDVAVGSPLSTPRLTVESHVEILKDFSTVEDHNAPEAREANLTASSEKLYLKSTSDFQVQVTATNIDSLSSSSARVQLHKGHAFETKNVSHESPDAETEKMDVNVDWTSPLHNSDEEDTYTGSDEELSDGEMPESLLGLQWG